MVPISNSHIQFQMFSSINLLCFYKQPPSVFVVHSNEGIFKDKRLITNTYSSSSSHSCFGIVHASLKEDSQSQQYEVEPEKAREALKKLDEQMQSLSSKKQPSNAPKFKVSEVKLPTELGSGKEKLEISDSSLAIAAGGLVLFTMFYNVLFYTVIKPAIDGS